MPMNRPLRSALAIALLCPAALLAQGQAPAAIEGVVSTAFSIGDVAIAEGGGSLQFTITASPPPSVLTTVDFATSSGSALSDADFTAISGTRTFNIGVATQIVAVTLVSDITVEADENFNVTLFNPSAGATLADALAAGTIDNDDQTTLTLPDSEVDEGDAGSVPMGFALSLGNPVQGSVLINFQTADGNDGNATLNATVADADYAASSGAVTFANLATGPQPISIQVAGDIKVEPDQQLRLGLSIGSLPAGIDPADVILPVSAALGVIRNDDGAVISVGDTSVTEGDAGSVTLDFPIPLSNPSKTPISVHYVASAGTAGAADFTSIVGDLVIPALSPSGLVSVPVSSEFLVEPDETVVLTLSAPSGGFLGDNVGLGTIVNDDSAVLAIADAGQAEGDAINAAMTFAVTLSHPVQGSVTVNASSADGGDSDPLLNATLADNDYLPRAATIGFTAGVVAQDFTVSIVGDTDVEPNQRLRVSLSSLGIPPGLPAGSVTLGTATAIGEIQNDDGSVLAIGDASVIEGNGGTASLAFPITLTAASKAPVLVDYQAIAQTASAGGDFVAASGTFTLPANTTTGNLNILVNGDNVVEGSETLQVLLTNAQGVSIGDGDAIGTITDNDTALLRLVDASAGEQASSLVLQATLSNPVQGVVTVQYVSSDGSADAGDDYSAVSGQVSFMPLATTVGISIPIIGDTLAENAETVTVTLSNPSPGAPQVVLDRATATGVIIDDDTPLAIPAGTLPGWIGLALLMLMLAGKPLGRHD